MDAEGAETAKRLRDNFKAQKEFLLAVDRVRSTLSQAQQAGPRQQEKLQLIWIKAVRKLSSVYGVRLSVPFKVLDERATEGELERLADGIERAISELDLAVQVDDAIFRSGSFDFVELDDDWKGRATAYVAHIREVVSKAEMGEAIRERIFKRLNDLQGELDRNRTRVESISEVFLSITEAVGKGAKHLEGAVKLVERLAGAFSGARSASIEHDTQLRLPPPEDLGLDDPK